MHHFLSQKHPHKSRDRHNSVLRRVLDLEPYIQLEQEQITRSRAVIHSVRFNLDQDILQKIQYAQETGRRLDVSRKFLADLRSYALINPKNQLQSELTFYTYYQRGSSQEALMRSVISTDGEVLHQIKNDCLAHPDFCRQLASAHYWLIDQLLSQLRLRTFLPLNSLIGLLSWLMAAVSVLPFVPLLIENSPWMLLAVVVIGWLLQRVLHRLLRRLLPKLGRWVLRQLLSKLLSPKPLDKKIAKSILAWLES